MSWSVSHCTINLHRNRTVELYSERKRRTLFRLYIQQSGKCECDTHNFRYTELYNNVSRQCILSHRRNGIGHSHSICEHSATYYFGRAAGTAITGSLFGNSTADNSRWYRRTKHPLLMEHRNP